LILKNPKDLVTKIKQIFVNAGINAVPECDDDYLKTIQDEILRLIEGDDSL